MVVSCLLWGYQCDVFPVERDEEFVTKTLVPETLAFWNHVQAGTRPPPDPSDECKAAILRLFPESEPERFIESDADMDDLDSRYFVLKEQADALKAEMNGIKNEFRDRLEDAEGVAFEDGRTWTHRGKNGKRRLTPPRRAWK